MRRPSRKAPKTTKTMKIRKGIMIYSGSSGGNWFPGGGRWKPVSNVDCPKEGKSCLSLVTEGDVAPVEYTGGGDEWPSKPTSAIQI